MWINPAQTGVTLQYLATAPTTWLYFDKYGVLHQQTDYYTDQQIEDTIAIGALVHPNNSTITLARSIPNVAYATDKQYEQFIRAFNPYQGFGSHHYCHYGNAATKPFLGNGIHLGSELRLRRKQSQRNDR